MGREGPSALPEVKAGRCRGTQRNPRKRTVVPRDAKGRPTGDDAGPLVRGSEWNS